MSVTPQGEMKTSKEKVQVGGSDNLGSPDTKFTTPVEHFH